MVLADPSWGASGNVQSQLDEVGYREVTVQVGEAAEPVMV